MKKSYLLCLLAVLVCFAGKAQQYNITADLTGFADSTWFYLEDLDTDAVIDSARIMQGKFTLTGHCDNPPQQFWIYTQDENKFHYVSLLIGNETVHIKGDLKDFPFYLSVTGSPIQDDVNALSKITREGFIQRNKLVEEIFSIQGDSAEVKQKALWDVVRGIDSINKVQTMAFIKTHPMSYVSLQHMFYLRKTYGRDSIGKMLAALPADMRKGKLAQRLANYLKVGDPVRKGDTMADFTAFDRQGKTHRLSDFKGKYILLDFSATNCGPCVESLHDLRALQDKYRDKLTIITVSGDVGRKVWLEGLDRDHPEWLCLWDGKGIYGETMLKYGISGWPTFVLIDPTGKIIDMHFGFNMEKDGKGTLEKKVEKLIVDR